MSSPDTPYSGGLKLIGAGLPRTGTASLKEALEILYKASCYHMKAVNSSSRVQFWTEAAQGLKSENDYLEHMEPFAAAVDAPSCMRWKDLMKTYPNAKVLLSTRSPDTWLKSIKETVLKMNSSYSRSPWGVWFLQTLFPFGRGYYFWKMNDLNLWTPLFKGDYSEANMRKAFIDWLEDVKSKCPPEKLLIYEVSQGWGPLCEFLGLPVPDVPFPCVNDTESFKEIVKKFNAMGFMIAGGLSISLAISVGIFYRLLKS